jgi:predicted ArsR family transcriptional regulator
MKHARQVSPRSYAAQPKIRLLKRKRAITAAEAAKALGCADAGARAVVSRLEQQGTEITRRKERGRTGTVYTLVERFAGRKDGAPVE